MSDILYELIAKQGMLEIELAELHPRASKSEQINKYEYFAEKYYEHKFCKKTLDYLSSIHWQTCDNQELIRAIDLLTDKGIFFKSLLEWVKNAPERDTQDVRKILNDFTSETQEKWQIRFGVPFDYDEPFAKRVSERVSLSLRRFREVVCDASAEIMFDNALSVGLLTYILGYKPMDEVYFTDALVIIDRLNFDGDLIYHAVKWVEEYGLTYLEKGESLLSAAARFADYVVTQ